MDHYKSDGVGGMGDKSKIKNFAQVIINKKYIFLSIVANICPRREKRFPPYMYKRNLASLKIPNPPPPSPSLSFLTVHPLIKQYNFELLREH